MLTTLLLTSLIVLPVMPADDALGQATDLVHAGKYDQAARVLAEALDAGEGDEGMLRLALADAHIRMGQPRDALATLEGLDAGDSDVALAMGRAYVALADAMAAEGASSDDVEATLADGRDLLERAVATGNGGAPVWELGSVLLYRYNLLDDSLQLANDALKRNDADGEALLLRGAAGAYVYWNAGQDGDVNAANEAWSQAVADLEKADKLLGPHRIEPLGQLVWFYEAQDISGKAVDAAIRLGERQPEPDFALLYRLARKYRDLGRLEASGKALEHMVNLSARDLTLLIEADPEPDVAAASLSGSIHPFYERGDKATCRTILKAIVTADPKDSVVWNNYAVICTETSRFDDAVSAYERAIELNPDDPRLYNDLGSVFQHNLRRDAARSKSLYEQCIALADKQLAMIDAPPEVKSNAAEAKRVAQDNMRSLGSGSGDGGGLLDSMVQGLRNLNLPKPTSDGDEGGGDGGGASDG